MDLSNNMALSEMTYSKQVLYSDEISHAVVNDFLNVSNV